MLRLEVGPGHDVVASSGLRLHGNSDTKTRRAHRPLGAESLDGLHEAPSRDRAELDFTGLEDAVATNDAPSVVKRVDNYMI